MISDNVWFPLICVTLSVTIGYWTGIMAERHEWIYKIHNYLRGLYYRWKHRNSKCPPYDPGEPITVTYVGGPWDGEEGVTTTNIKTIQGYTHSPAYFENPITFQYKPQIDYEYTLVIYQRSPDDPTKFIYVEPKA